MGSSVQSTPTYFSAMSELNTTSWVDVPHGHDFPLANLPFGIFSAKDRGPRPGMRLGDKVIDLSACHAVGLLNDLGLSAEVLAAHVLNPLMKILDGYGFR